MPASRAPASAHDSPTSRSSPRGCRRLKKVQMRGGEGGGPPRRTFCTLSGCRRPRQRSRWAFFSRLLGLGEGDEERAKLHGLEAGGDLAVLPCPRDLGEMEAGLVAEAAP